MVYSALAHFFLSFLRFFGTFHCVYFLVYDCEYAHTHTHMHIHTHTHAPAQKNTQVNKNANTHSHMHTS